MVGIAELEEENSTSPSWGISKAMRISLLALQST
jgi:hypothetical protein